MADNRSSITVTENQNGDGTFTATLAGGDYRILILGELGGGTITPKSGTSVSDAVALVDSTGAVTFTAENTSRIHRSFVDELLVFVMAGIGSPTPSPTPDFSILLKPVPDSGPRYR